jgi:hypothetical protein
MPVMNMRPIEDMRISTIIIQVTGLSSKMFLYNIELKHPGGGNPQFAKSLNE